MSAHFVNRDDVIGVLFRFQIENERRKSEHTQRRRGKDRAFETGTGAIAQNFSRRARGVSKIVGQLIEKTLDAGWRFQRTQSSQFRRAEARSALSLLSVSPDNDQIAFDAVQLRDPRQQSPALESSFFEKTQTRLVMGKDVTDQRRDFERWRARNRFVDQTSRNAASPKSSSHVNAHFRRPGIGAARQKWLQTEPRDHPLAIVYATQSG